MHRIRPAEHAVSFSAWKRTAKCRMQLGLTLLLLSIQVYPSAFKPPPTEPHSTKLSHDMWRSGRQEPGFYIQRLTGRVHVNISWGRVAGTSNRWHAVAAAQTDWRRKGEKWGSRQENRRGWLSDLSVCGRNSKYKAWLGGSSMPIYFLKLPKCKSQLERHMRKQKSMWNTVQHCVTLCNAAQ